MKKYTGYLVSFPLVIGILTLVGWAFSIDFLKHPFGETTGMNPMTAACFILAGLAFLTFGRAAGSKPLLTTARAFCAIVIAIGSVKQLAILGVGFNVDARLFSNKDIAEGLQQHLFNMSANTSFNFVLTGSSLLLARSVEQRWRNLANFLSLTVFIIALFSFIGFIYRVNVNNEFNDYLPLAVQTALCFMCLSLAVLFANSDSAFMRVISNPHSGGRIARLLLPVAVLVPILFGYIRLALQWQYPVPVELGVAALTTSIIIVFFIATWFVARALNASDEARRRSEQLYQQMVAEIRDYAIILLDPQGNIINWNSGAEKMKGYTSQQIIGKNFRIFYPTAALLQKQPERLLKQAAETGHASDEGWRVKRDGNMFWASITLSALHDDNNNVIGFSKVTKDLTEQKKAEMELRQQAILFDIIPDAVMYGTRTMTEIGITSLNRAAEDLFDISSEKAAGLKLDDMLKIELAGATREQIGRALWSAEGFWKGEAIFTTLTGKRINTFMRLKTIRHNDGETIDWVGIFTDTGTLLMNDELKAANTYLEQLAFISAHDIKAPIHSLNGLTDLMLRSKDLHPEHKQIMDLQRDVLLQMQRTNRGLNDILKLRQGLRTKQHTRADFLPLRAITDNTRATVQAELKAADAELLVVLNDLPEVQFPFFYLQSVFNNLITNSIKYRNPEHHTVIRLEAKAGDDNTFIFTITDNGLGMDMAYARDKLFGLFKRFHPQIEGTGVGLHIVKSIVDAYNGQIVVNSKIGVGTTFEITVKNTILA